MTDWVSWHGAYADPRSELSRRLVVVRRWIGAALDRHPSSRIRILSLCAGDGRDLLPELRRRPGLEANAVLVELDPRLAAAARDRAVGRRGVEVRHGDAGAGEVFADVVPVDLLLLCGIFGNISHEDIRATIDAIPAMLAPDGTVIWTRGWFPHEDLRPTIRAWFTEAGLEEIGFDQEPQGYGVGVSRATGDRGAPLPPARLFTFVR